MTIFDSVEHAAVLSHNECRVLIKIINKNYTKVIEIIYDSTTAIIWQCNDTDKRWEKDWGIYTILSKLFVGEVFFFSENKLGRSRKNISGEYLKHLQFLADILLISESSDKL